jgi:hypothetical protein
MLRGRAVISVFIPLGGFDQNLQQDARRSWCEVRWLVGDDHSRAATVVGDSPLSPPAR